MKLSFSSKRYHSYYSTRIEPRYLSIKNDKRLSFEELVVNIS